MLPETFVLPLHLDDLHSESLPPGAARVTGVGGLPNMQLAPDQVRQRRAVQDPKA